MLHNPVGCLALDMREVKEVSVHSLSVYLSHKGNEAFCFFCLNAGCRNLICAGVLTSTFSLNSGCAILEKWWFWKFEAELWWFILGFSCFWGCWPNLFPWSCNLWLNTHTHTWLVFSRQIYTFQLSFVWSDFHFFRQKQLQHHQTSTHSYQLHISAHLLGM